MIRVRQNLFRLFLTGLLALMLTAPIANAAASKVLAEGSKSVPAAVIACTPSGSSGSCSGG